MAVNRLIRPTIRLWHVLLACLSFLLLTGAAQGVRAQQNQTLPHQPRQVVPTKQKFRLDTDVLVTSAFDHKYVSSDFAQWLRTQHVPASTSLTKAKNRIVFEQVASIPGVSGSDALQITVKTRRITVNFTTENSLRYAVRILEGMILQDNRGVKYFPGGTVSDWGTRSGSGKELMLDAASTMRPVSELETMIRRIPSVGKRGEIYVVLVDPAHWRMQSPSLEGLDPDQKLYPGNGYYRQEQLTQIREACRKSDLEMVPTLELFAENTPFTDALGHSVFSVEGMRLVRAALEDCKRILNPKKICLGAKPDGIPPRYQEFITELADILQVELVIL